jgi:thioesterase domain-containing protein/acyl carrier protein
MAGNFTAKLGELALIQEQDEARLAVQSGKPGPRVHDMAGRLAPPGLPGEIWTITAHAATGGGLRPTGYRGVRHADGAIECLGRKDAPARIGGYSVDPAEVAAVLRLHPLVVESAVVTQAPQGEPQLAAFVVPSADAATAITARGHGLLLEQLRRFVSDRLPEPMVPRAWRILDALPRDACGAIEVHRLPPACRARPAAAGQYHPPGDALEERLCGIWSEILGIDPVGTSDRFFDLGGDSTLVVALAARLEAEFGRRLPLARMLGQPTVKRLADCLRRRPNGAEQVLVPIRPSGTRPPLFCVHPAGGTLFCYLELAAHLQTEIPLYGLQAQGIDGELEPHDSVEAMAAAYAPALKKIQPGGPYQLCGWSTGGLIAFELARQLQAAGDEVSRLILFDAAIPRPGETFDENDLAALLGLLFPDEHPQRIEHPRQLPLEEQLVEFQRRSQRAQLLLSDASSSQVQRIYEVFQANMKAVVSYLPSAFPGRLTLIRATQRATPMHDDPLLGWGPWAAGGIEVYEVPCGHLTMFQQPAVRQVAEILEKCLTERGGQSDRRRAVVAG